MNTETSFEQLCLEQEPYFAFMQHTGLKSPDGLAVEKSLGYLNYCIIENPSSLRHHITKIKLILEDKAEADQLVAALADLFCVLKKDGYELRKRMLRYSRSRLDEGTFMQLIKKLKSGDLLVDENWLASYPTLTPISSVVEVIKNADKEAENGEQTQDSLTLAYEYIENSQMDQALDTLEAAALEEPADIEIAELLIELYKQMSDNERLFAMHQKLQQGGDHDLPKCWVEALNVASSD